MEFPDNTENISPSHTIHVENIGELYDYVIEELLEYTENDMESFDVHSLDDKSDAIRVVLFGSEDIHNNRIKTLHKRMKVIGNAQATVESIQINYLAKETPNSTVFAFVDDLSEPVEFIIESE